MFVAHPTAVEFFRVALKVLEARLIGMFATGRIGAVVAVVRIEVFVDMTVEMVMTVVPGAGADKDSAGKPFRAIVAVGRAVVGWKRVVAVRADRRRANVDGNLCRRRGSGARKCRRHDG